MTRQDHSQNSSISGGPGISDLPIADVPFFSRLPKVGMLGNRLLTVLGVILVLFLIDQATYLPLDLWLLQSLKLESIFWTNFNMGALLFVIGFAVFALAVIVPAFVHASGSGARRRSIKVGLMVGLLAGYFLCLRYQDFLLLLNGEPFGETDPVFGYDIRFFVFFLPTYWTMVVAAFLCVSVGLISSASCAYLAQRHWKTPEGISRFMGALGRMASPYTLLMVGVLGFLTALSLWLSRYGLLLRDNKSSSVFNGAEYLDVTGVFSTLVDYHVTAWVALAVTIALLTVLASLRRGAAGKPADWRRSVRRGLVWVLVLVAFDFAFKGVVLLRDLIAVVPNEPVVQLEYIDRHIKATRKGYDLDKIETVEFIPKDLDDPIPDARELLATPALKNAPLWPGFVNYLEFHIDPQHRNRIVQTGGDPMIYGPTLEVFRQQEKYRTYYNFINVDTVRYDMEGETRVFASAVRETPLIEPNPWLAWWGQRFMLFTHGYGLVMASIRDVDSEGEPVYASKGVPAKATHPVLHQETQGIYYGEGSMLMGVSNVRKMKELDYPTEEGRAEIYLPLEVDSGVNVDSLTKRLVLGWRSGEFFEIVFSRLIGEETRVHYFRTPLVRLERIAPFLYIDTNPYAVTVDGRIYWMVNAMTTTDQYPYSKIETLGDKSIERTRYLRPFRDCNYVRDTVKATIDAYTGQVKLYQVMDEPVIRTWGKVYPGVLKPLEDMPKGLRDHLQYPLQLFHIQFDDVYIFYHMNEPMYFFNMEDVWDDGDEVIGPIMDKGRAIVWSIEPYHWLVDTTDHPIPASEKGTQFVLSLVQTPEKSLNLRAILMAYQDGKDYGRLVSLQVPKPLFYLGPEQADSAIDQEPEISEQISWWNRQGNDVIRGHTITLVVKGEVLYVEPIFIRSQQNPVTQMKRVIVVFRGNASMGDTLEEALELAIDLAKKAQEKKRVMAEAGDSGG
ncbi:MAG: UPF0182 family protein [Deltaproteobacteria bacterium]|nr:UPF0182 family protein [Deltaproteobacteria bacterium]